MCVFFVMPLIFNHFDNCRDQIWLDYKGNTVAESQIMPMQPMASQWKHANPLTTLTIFISQRMFKFHWHNSACLSRQGGYYLHKENCKDLYLVSIIQWQSTIGYSVGNLHDRSRTIENGWHHFQKKLTWVFLPLLWPLIFDQTPQT